MLQNVLLRFAFILTLATCGVSYAADPNKVFRYAFEVAETRLDPHRVSDLYSSIINNAIFDAPLRYDYLARPPKLVPNTLAAMPEISEDGLIYTMRVKPGIYFDNDPAFKGVKRELTAADFVYSIKRLYDPKNAAPLLGAVEEAIDGMDGLLARARKENKFDYDAVSEGLKVIDRYTFQIKLKEKQYNFIFNLADCRITCAVAREVVEAYGEDFGNRPVGTNAYRVAYWKRASKLVFEPNPNYREEYFDGQPAPGDTEAEAILAAFKGKRVPMVGRVELYIIEEEQPRLLAFLNQEHDMMFRVPETFSTTVMPSNQLAANLARQNIRMAQIPAMDLRYVIFNMDDPVIGGYTPDKVALRRAITLGFNTEDEIRVVWKNQGVRAHTPYPPGVSGYDPAFRTDTNEYDLPRAKALLDLYGYVDRDGDGWRDLPDGSPLIIEHNSTPTARDKQIDELWKRSMDALSIRFTVKKGQWPDQLKAAQQGKLQMWYLGGTSAQPTAEGTLENLYGPNTGIKNNLSRFRSNEFDRLFKLSKTMPDTPERTAIYNNMSRIVLSYAPWKIQTHRILTDIWQPWVMAYRRPQIANQNFWKFIDIDTSKIPEDVKQAMNVR